MKGRYGELKSCKWFAVPELIQLCRYWLFGAGEQGKQQRGNEWRWEHVSKNDLTILEKFSSSVSQRHVSLQACAVLEKKKHEVSL